MSEQEKIQLFEDQKIRTAWDTEKEEWYFSVTDVISVLTGQQTARGASNYWAKLKQQLKEGAAQPMLLLRNSSCVSSSPFRLPARSQ